MINVLYEPPVQITPKTTHVAIGVGNRKRPWYLFKTYDNLEEIPVSDMRTYWVTTISHANLFYNFVKADLLESTGRLLKPKPATPRSQI